MPAHSTPPSGHKFIPSLRPPSPESILHIRSLNSISLYEMHSEAEMFSISQPNLHWFVLARLDLFAQFSFLIISPFIY